MSAAEQLARQLDQARRDADSKAQEARELILSMRDQHANLLLVIDGIREAVADATWADFSVVLSHLEEAVEAMGGVFAYQREAA